MPATWWSRPASSTRIRITTRRANAPGQSAQPGSPFYDNLTDYLGNGEYFPFLFTREAIEEKVAHRLTLRPAS